MKKNRRKGATILSVLVLMSVVICVSLLLFSFTINTKISLKKESLKLDKLALTSRIFNDFIDNGKIDDNYDLTTLVYISDENESQRAVVVKKSNKKLDIYYYCVYDFASNEVIAKQYGNIYTTKKEYNGKQFYYIADLIRYEEV